MQEEENTSETPVTGPRTSGPSPDWGRFHKPEKGITEAWVPLVTSETATHHNCVLWHILISKAREKVPVCFSLALRVSFLSSGSVLI